MESNTSVTVGNASVTISNTSFTNSPYQQAVSVESEANCAKNEAQSGQKTRSYKPPDAKCPECGEFFSRKRRDHKYCTSACRKIASLKRNNKYAYQKPVRDEIKFLKKDNKFIFKTYKELYNSYQELQNRYKKQCEISDNLMRQVLSGYSDDTLPLIPTIPCQFSF